MTAEKKEQNHAEQNAKDWMETIQEHVACLDADRERLEELRDEREALADDAAEERDDSEINEGLEARAAIAKWDEENAEELAELVKAVTVDGEEMDADAIRERIEESPLSVQVRYGWISPGETHVMITSGPEEYEILLSTGGPALRIIGELGAHNEPTSARLQYQDWGTPWTEYISPTDRTSLLRWASCFYFGD